MDHIKIIDAGSKGQGLFARRAITCRDTLYAANKPVIAAINTSQLHEFCYNCYAGSRPGTEQWYSIGQYRDADLKVCTGCRTAYFCGKKCQTQAWKGGHKHECKMFASLRPKILPEQVRAVVTFLLQHDYDLLSDGTWERILNLMSHIESLQQEGGDQWLNLMLMAKAAHEYSKTKTNLETVLKLFCILKVNGMTLTTTYGDPIGVFLEPVLVMLNHSCEGNVVVHRPTYTNGTGWLHRRNPGEAIIKLLPLRDIAEGEELTSSYVEFTEHVSSRQSNLEKNYFFSCSCTKCQKELEVERQQASTNPLLNKLRQSWRESVNTQLELLKAPPFDLSTSIFALTGATEAMEASQSFSPAIDPYPRAIHELRLLHMNDHQACDKALICALKEHLLVSPNVYSSMFYPTSVVNAIYVLQVFALLDDTFDRPSPHGPQIAQQREKIEKLGLSRRSWKHWRLRIAVNTRACVLKSGMDDLAQCLEMEQIMIGITDQSTFQELLARETVKTSAEEEMRRVLGLTEKRWNEFVRPGLDMAASLHPNR